MCTVFIYKKNEFWIKFASGGVDSYLKSLCVTLVSAKYYNPDCDVALVTNLPENNIPERYVEILKKADVHIIEVPFAEFLFDGEYLWSLAFYKLCVLNYICTQKYENVCYMDTDVYVQSSFESIWEETKENILLLDINHGLHVEDYRVFCEEIRGFYKTKKLITHYGGEFFASSKENAVLFLQECKKVYAKMQDTGFVTKTGDEFIVSCAADAIKNKIRNAGAYVNRFWTNPSFRLISTNYKYNRVSALHLPAEKEHGFLIIFRRYIQNGKIPRDNVVWKTFRLERLSVFEKGKVLIRYFQKA